MISWITISSLLSVLMSTSGRLPAFRATSLFWISVDSLNRPPTLLTIASSRSSSSMDLPFWGTDDIANLLDRPVHVVVDHLVLIAIGKGQLAAGHFEPPLDRFLAFAAPAAQPTLQFVVRTG